MVCHNPYFKQHNGETLELQCGKCPRCKIRRVNQWIFRIQQEAKNSISAKFITLTYADKYLPRTQRNLGTLRKEDVQNFIKRLREHEKAAGNTEVIKYFAAGEYGDQTKRPHYHILILNIKDNNNIKKAWPKGHIDVGELNQNTIAYTIKYIDKDCGIGYHKTDQRQRQFQLISKGLGNNYLTPQQILYHQSNPLRNYVQNIQGLKVGLPRYYAKHIWNTEELAKIRRDILVPYLEQRQIQIEQQYNQKYKNLPYEDYKQLQIIKERTKFGKNITEYKRDKL